MWRHPKYYKELRKRNELAQRSAVKEDLACSGSSRISNKLDQAISDEASTEATSVRPGPGLSGKQQAASDSQVVNQVKLSSQSQAASTHPDLLPKHGPEYYAPRRRKRQATSKGKLQATSSKRQASE
jgi:hypothetical protein